MPAKITIALAGNPNSGKTTAFNALTGQRQHVGNYPGVTVEVKFGRCRRGEDSFELVDLPGTYSLTAHTEEELVTRRFLVERGPDVLVDIVDASNLERNLYLAVEFLELGWPVVLAFNMSDVAEARGMRFDLPQLSALLGAPIVPTVAHKGKGLGELLDAAARIARGAEPLRPRQVNYGREVEEEIARVAALLEAETGACGAYRTRWLAVKLLENDRHAREMVGSPSVLEQVDRSRHHLQTIFRDPPELVIAGRRYGFISGACQEAVRSTVELRHTVSDRIDAVLTHPVAGVPVLLALMYLVFHLTFTLGDWPMQWLEWLFGRLAEGIVASWPAGRAEALRSLLVDGVLAGVGGVVAFLPNILLLFLAIAVLEDSGYMARAAFLMDRLMHRIGLHGKSFIPMLIGFGCSVPAVMATRTLEGRRDRLVTMLVVPLMSCGARLTIYALFIPAFFAPRWRAAVLWLIYLIGVALAIGCARLLRATLLRGEAPAFVMELPLYRLPTLKALGVHMWDRAWMYLRKAGTLILAASVVMWALTSYPRKQRFERDYDAEAVAARAELLAGLRTLHAQLRLPADSNPPPDALGGVPEGGRKYAALDRALPDALERLERADPDSYAAAVRYLDEIQPRYLAHLRGLGDARRAEELAHSAAGRFGHALEPLLRPMGFDWRIGTALIGALAAKEVFVAQLGIIFAVGEGQEHADALRERLQANYTPLQAFCVMLFCLISAPCMATVAVTWRESGRLKWAALQLAGLTALAYVVTVVVYQVGRLVL